MKSFYAPFIVPAERPLSKWNWELVAILTALAAFWIGVGVLVVRAL